MSLYSEATKNTIYPGLSASTLVYGLLADALMIVPVVLYIQLKDGVGYAKYHQTYLKMLIMSYAPLGLSWMAVAYLGDRTARDALWGAVEFAGLGAMANNWIGFFVFLQDTHQDGVLDTTHNRTFAVVYAIVNSFLVFVHWLFAPMIYDWLVNAPLYE